MRSTIQCLGAVLGGAQSIHVMGYDEAFEIPSEEAVTLSLRTQQIIAMESGVTATADPLAGSFFVDRSPTNSAARARDVLAEIEDRGRRRRGLEQGDPATLDRGVGLPHRARGRRRRAPQGGRERATWTETEMPGMPALFEPDEGIVERQIERTRAPRGRPRRGRPRRAMTALARDARADGRTSCRR